MTDMTHYRRVRWLVLAAMLTALPAAAQLVPNQLVVVDVTEAPPYWSQYVADVTEAYSDVQLAINDAVTYSRDAGEPYTVLVVARNNSLPWTGGVTMPADADVRILGSTRYSGSDVYEPVLDGNGLDVITISTTTANFINDTSKLYSPRIEGLHLVQSGGADVSGIRIVGDYTSPYRPTINRCWMDGHPNHGVSIEGNNASALLINCSISDNAIDGVHIDTNPDSPGTFTDIIHCAIIGNGQHGVWVNRSWAASSGTEPPKYARVRNSIVYKNATASSEPSGGGLVWSGGIAIIPEWDVITGGASAAIYGKNLSEAGADTRVYFGPRDIGADNPPVLFNPLSAPDRLEGLVPPSYNSAPGKVDVHIVRAFGTEDERTYTLQDAFTYVEDPAVEPQVTLVTPSHGPPEGGNWVLVEGVRFNVDGEVWWDFNSNGLIDGGMTRDLGPNGVVGPNTFAPYNPVPVWIPDQFRDNYLAQGGTRWLITSNTVDTLTLAGPTAALIDGAWSIVRPGDLRANERTWLSSALLHVEAPAAPGWYDPIFHNSAPMDVLVRNLYPSGAHTDSPAGDENMREYRYRGEDSTATVGSRPDIVQVMPNFYRRLNTDADPGQIFRIDILGWNLADGCTVRIGGEMCPYASVSTLVGGLPEGDWRKIIDVQVPLAEFGAGGSYDVEITNPNGLYDILPTGFTYFADSTPLLDNDPELPFLSTDEFEWSPSNFIDYNSGALINSAALTTRTLYGDSFDAGLRITFDDLGGNTYTIDDPLNNPGDAGADGVAMPNENVEQHVKHTQRFIEFALPARPDDITVANAFIDRTGGMPYVPAFNTAGLAVAIENVRSADLQDTYGPGPVNDYKRTSSRFFWINDPDVYFEVVGATLNCANNRAILTVVPSTSAGASSYVYSWAVNDFWVYVENKQIPEADITSIVPDPGGFGATFIEFSLDSLPAGLYGQRDVTVVLRSTSAFNPVNYALYSTLKDGVYVPPDGSAWRLYARAVHPRTVPAAPLADEEFQVRVLGSGLAHKPDPEDGSPTTWPWTDVELRWPGNALSLRTVPAAECTVISFFEAVFTVFDVASYGVPTSSPGNVNPVDVALVTYDGCTGLKLDEDVVVDGIIFWEFLPRIIKTNVSPRTVESGVAGAGAAGTFTVAGAGWEPGAYGGHYLLDSAFNAYMIQTNSDEMLTLYGGSPSSGAWRIVRGAYPIDSGLSGTWNAGTEQFTAVPDPGWGSLAGQYLIDASNNSFLIKDNTSNALTLHHVDAPPVNGGWRIAEPVHWGPVSGGDVLNIEGADFPIDEYPMARIGAVESMVTAYNSGYIRVKTPPAPFGLPATYDVSSVWTITAAGNTQPAPVEARAPEPERFTYIMDGPPKIVEIEPNQIYVNTSLMPGLMQDPEQFITITGYNFDDRVIVTFSFTDESSAVPTTVPVVLYHFSVSPNMIVIRAPDFMTLLDPLLHAEPDSTLDLLNNQTGAAEPDGYPDPTTAGNHYKVVVTVTNYVDDPGPPAPVGDSMLTSNPDNIFYVIDSEDMLEPSAADLLFNDVYLNYRDYVNVNPGTGSIAKDPMLLPEGAPASKPWWRGKLEVVGDGTLWGRNELNPVRDKAGKFIERPFTEADYELETRPDLGEPFNVQGTGEWPEPPPGEESQPRLPDIGADELMGGNPDIDMRYWYYAEVIPDPVPAMDAGELQVQIRVYGVIVPGSIYLVPQGVVFANGALDIPANRARCIEIQLQSYGEGVYFGTNAAPITTLIEDMDGSGGPSQGDYLADGHAAIVIPLGGGEYWGDDPVDLTDGGVIVEQAINGRHCLIDTIPPRPVLVLPTAPAQPSDIMTLNNAPGPYAAQGVALPDPTHPYSAVASATWRPWVEPSPSGGPFDGILPALPFAPPVPPVRDGVQAFFNPGSLSNSYPVEDLSITIGPGIAAGQYLAFLDTPPWYFDPGDLQRHVIQGNVTDTDYYTGAQTREVAGFPETVSGPVVVTDHTKPPTITVFSDSTYIPAIGEMVYTYEVSSALPAFLPSFVYAPFGNPGFDRDLPTQTVDYANDVVVSRWTFSDGGTPGLDYAKVSTGDAMHMGMRFAAVDLAGNVTRMTRNDGDALNTLHVWWMTRAETTLLPDIDGEEISVLPFYWYLDRPTTEDPEAQDIDAMPRFLWRLWYSDFIDGAYTPYTDWSTWTTDTQLADVAPGLAETLRAAGLAENWFLLVVVGVDEAGNYEVWPAGDLTLDASGLVTPTGSRDRRNWVRFYLGGGEIDTTLTHELWHNGDAPDAYQTLNKADGDVSFGPAAMVALHPDTPDPRVEGLFTIGVTLPPGLEGEDIAVQWSLQRDGGVLYQGVIPDPDPAGPWVYYTASGQTQTLQLPVEGNVAFLFDDIPEGQNSVTYVLTAQAFWDADGNESWDVGERIDNTPASVQFKVVRDTSDTVGGYLQRERQRGKQQIILREE